MLTEVNSKQVTARVKDWINRLNRLYDTLDEWMTDIPHDQVARSSVLQPIEPFMRRFNVPPRKVPTYTILKGNRRVAFVPSVLSVPATNGRVDITTKVRQHILVDRDGRWQLATRDYKRLVVPFNKTQLKRLLAEGE